jgi:hypothetical protein
MPTDPQSLTWYAVGTKAKPAGTAGKLTPERRAVLAVWMDEDAAAVETPAVPVTPTPAPPPVVTPPATGRKTVGRSTWATASAGGTFLDYDISGPADAARDDHGIQVLAPKTDLTVRNVASRRWSNGLNCEHTPAVLNSRHRKWTVEGSLFADNNGPLKNRGQGAYIAAGDEIDFIRCCFIGNGIGDNKRLAGDTTGRVYLGFCHGCYVQGGFTQWHMPEGCTRVRFIECVAINNAAWGLLNRSDGGEVRDCFLAGNAYALLASGPLPVAVTGNVVIPGPRAVSWYDPKQKAGTGGIQYRAASGTLSDNLCILPPECRMPDRNWRAPAYELANDANVKPNYHGPVVAAGGNNYAFGWDADVTNWGTPVPGLSAGPCPAADWAGLVADAERQARAGTADAVTLIAHARKMAGVN